MKVTQLLMCRMPSDVSCWIERLQLIWRTWPKPRRTEVRPSFSSFTAFRFKCMRAHGVYCIVSV